MRATGLRPAYSIGDADVWLLLSLLLRVLVVHACSIVAADPRPPFVLHPSKVRMNDMLSYLLTYKLKGEDVVRGSGLPHTIIRPCALTEEPAGAPMIVAQGDNIKGKISR